MASTQAPSTPPACPRCQYDQSGTIAAWPATTHPDADGAACPLHSRCPECGLDFAWADVLNAARHDLPRFYEHSPRWWGGRAIATTLAWSILPWRFWSRVAMHHRIVRRRWGLWLLLLFVAPLVLTSALTTIMMLRTYLNKQPIVATMAAELRSSLDLDLVAALMRAWNLPVGAQAYHGWAARPPVTTPFLRFRAEPSAISPLLIAHSFVAAVFIVLPVTRRLAKLRWHHLARAWVFGLASQVPLVALRLIETVAWLFDGGPVSPVPITPNTAIQFTSTMNAPRLLSLNILNAYFVLAALWLAAWWYFALTRGFRLPHARRTWLLLITAGFLAGAIWTHARQLT